MRVVLIPVAPTDWCAEGRLLGRVEIPPTEAGERAVADWAVPLRACGIGLVYHAPDELATKTAKIVASALGVKTKKVAGLAEVDVGLWAGLTDEDLRSRYASAHHELNESPMNVSPPDGEDFAAAEERVSTTVQKLVRKNGMPAIALVGRPLSMAIARHMLERSDNSKLWETAQDADAPVIVDTNAASTPKES